MPRIQLDTQRRETERLQRQLLGDSVVWSSNNNNASAFTVTSTNSTAGISSSGFGVVSSTNNTQHYHRTALSSSLSALGVLQNINANTDGNDTGGGGMSSSSSNSILSQHQQQQQNSHNRSPVKSAFSTIPSGDLGQNFHRRMAYDYQPP